MIESRRRILGLVVLLCLPLGLAAGPVSYDIVYVRAPRAGDNTYVRFPEVFFPTAMPSGSDLMLLHANGTEETLFAAGQGAVLDPAVSFDAQWVFFSYIPDASSNGINPQRGLAYGGADIYKINVATRQVVRLTQQVWTPPTGSANWSTDPLNPSSPNTVYLGYGLFNLGACPLPGGKVMFVSSRDGYLPNKGYTTPNLRLYIMDDDGRNVEPVGHLNIGSALHPTVLMDGRVMFASFEGQGVRDQRNWGLWAIWPDGRSWEPLMSALTEASAFHFQAQLSDGRIAVTQYYNLNDNGFGTILAFNSQKQPGTIPFGSPNASDASNPSIQVGLWGPGVPTSGQPRYTSYPFSPPGLVNLTAFSHGEDMASSIAQDGGYAGKATHPAGAPNNDMLLVWTPGPANNLNRPTPIPYYDAGIYLLKAGQSINDYRNLIKIKNDPNYNEIQPKALVPYSAIYGIAQPAALPYLPNDGSVSALLPPGTPFGLIGTSSFYNRNTTPGYGGSLYNGLDSFNTSENGESSNWFEQGADAGNYTNTDIYAVRILAMEGVAHRSYPSGDDTGFINFSDRERLRILGEIPLRKTSAGGKTVLDSQGNPDTSFLAKVPADTPFSFQTLDKNGLVLNMAQTWHMLRPGEVRNNCGGCHAHNRLPVDFASTAAAQASYPVTDLTAQTQLLTKDSAGNTTVKMAGRLIVDVEFYKDIKPILQRSCVQCHSQSGTAAAGLVLDDTALVNGYDNTYNRLANDSGAQWGIPPVIANLQWRQTNASRYVRMFQSRRSLLVWKVFGQRLDGWSNADHPTESTPGNPATLPQGADPNAADIDYTGAIMPPPNSGVPPLTEDEKMTIARWIDLGAPITAQGDTYKGYFADEIKPTLTVSSPRSGPNVGSLATIRIGMFDAYSGIDVNSLSVIANFPANAKPAGAELGASFSQTDPSVWVLNLSSPITSLPAGELTVKVKDLAGNWSVVDRTFTIVAGSNQPALSIAKTHSGNFTQGQQNAAYTVTVSNAANAAQSSGTVTVTEIGPSGLTLFSMNGTGWTCSGNTCTRSDALNPGGSYPPITVTVNVAAHASSPQVNQVSVSGGGSATANATDSTTILTSSLPVQTGVFRNGLWIIDVNGDGVINYSSLGVDRVFQYSMSPGDVRVLGDWNGDGKTKTGIFRNGLWILDANGNGVLDNVNQPGGDLVFQYTATPGDIPVIGDWNGDGRTKTGVFRNNGVWILDVNGDGVINYSNLGVDKVFQYTATPGDLPVVGDWNGDGKTKTGVFRNNGVWILDVNGDGVVNYSNLGVDKVFQYTATPGDLPVVGDWNGDGRTKTGVFRGGVWILDVNGDGVINYSNLGVDKVFQYTATPGDTPVVGDWNGDGKAKTGVFRNNGVWIIDVNGDGVINYSNLGVDKVFQYTATAGDKPLVGRW